MEHAEISRIKNGKRSLEYFMKILIGMDGYELNILYRFLEKNKPPKI
jgi:hypothetical protein